MTLLTLQVVQQKLLGMITDAKMSAEEKVTCCCCVGKGSASLKAHVDKSAYVPGERVGILCNIANNSEEGFNKVKVELKRVLHLHSNRRHSHTDTTVIDRSDHQGVGPNEVRDMNNPLQLQLQLR